MTPAREEPFSPTEGISSDASSAASADEMLAIFESDEQQTSEALLAAHDSILDLSRMMAGVLAGEGRVVTIGAGTSGRIGALDLAEWGPTFGVEAARRIALIAGGEAAFGEAVEGAEDDVEAAANDLDAIVLGAADLLIAISASGSASYVAAAIDHAGRVGAARALVTSHPQAFDDREGLLRVVVDSGTEVVQGSTRLKAATAAHRVMQRASTLCALQLGSIYRGRMVEMRPTNDKLRRRAATIVSDLGEVDRIRAAKLLVASGDDIKAAIVCAWFGVGPEEAADRLEGVGRRLEALEARRR